MNKTKTWEERLEKSDFFYDECSNYEHHQDGCTCEKDALYGFIRTEKALSRQEVLGELEREAHTEHHEGDLHIGQDLLSKLKKGNDE